MLAALRRWKLRKQLNEIRATVFETGMAARAKLWVHGAGESIDVLIPFKDRDVRILELFQYYRMGLFGKDQLCAIGFEQIERIEEVVYAPTVPMCDIGELTDRIRSVIRRYENSILEIAVSSNPFSLESGLWVPRLFSNGDFYVSDRTIQFFTWVGNRYKPRIITREILPWLGERYHFLQEPVECEMEPTIPPTAIGFSKAAQQYLTSAEQLLTCLDRQALNKPELKATLKEVRLISATIATYHQD